MYFVVRGTARPRAPAHKANSFGSGQTCKGTNATQINNKVPNHDMYMHVKWRRSDPFFLILFISISNHGMSQMPALTVVSYCMILT